VGRVFVDPPLRDACIASHKLVYAVVSLGFGGIFDKQVGGANRGAEGLEGGGQYWRKHRSLRRRTMDHTGAVPSTMGWVGLGLRLSVRRRLARRRLEPADAATAVEVARSIVEDSARLSKEDKYAGAAVASLDWQYLLVGKVEVRATRWASFPADSTVALVGDGVLRPRIAAASLVFVACSSSSEPTQEPGHCRIEHCWFGFRVGLDEGWLR